MSQESLWPEISTSNDYAELCNALYERELNMLAVSQVSSVTSVQAKLKSLPYYIKRTADAMASSQHNMSTALILDTQNASWLFKQQRSLPLSGQDAESIWQWYQKGTLVLGLVIPILIENRIVLDSIDRIESDENIKSANVSRFRTNVHGWFDKNRVLKNTIDTGVLLKPNKRVMSAACAGHCWQSDHTHLPKTLSLRELLLSCTINWRNFKNTVSF